MDIVGPLIQWFHLLIHNSGSFVSPVGQKPFPAMTSPAPPVPKCLISHWIARLGIPIDLSSDRGAQFTSQLWTSNDHYRLPPAIQWPSRKVPQTSEGSLTSSLALIGQLNYLAWVLLGICTAPKDDLGCSSAEWSMRGRGGGGHLSQCLVIYFVGHNLGPEHRSQPQQLQDEVRMQAPMPTSIYHPPSHNLKQSQFLFVRRDAHRTPF